MPPPPAQRAVPTARDRARAELTREITDAARRQLAEVGAGQLSVRAVARELGMASSAVYRYFPSRDELLTTLIVEAYESLAAAVERVEARVPRSAPRERFRVVLHGVRTWARAHPHEYALVYGTPVPGYLAPQRTVEPAARVPGLLLAAVRDADPPDRDGPPVPQQLSTQLDVLQEVAGMQLPSQVAARSVLVWTQLFGAVSMELFGHLVGSVDPSDDWFAWLVEELADLLGLTD